MYLIDMLPLQVKNAVEENWPIIIPVGSVEFHGNHLPLGTDFHLVNEIVKRFEPHVNCVVAPAFVYGCGGYAVASPKTGTIDIRFNSLREYAKDVLLAFYEMGFKRVIVVNQHQGVDGTSALAFKSASAEIFNEIIPQKQGNGWWTNNFENCNDFIMSVEVKSPLLGLDFWQGHGGRAETEPMCVLKEGTVEMDKLIKGDFPWNWEKGKEADDIDLKRGQENIDIIVDKWIEYLK